MVVDRPAGWVSIYSDERALARATPQTTRAQWRALYREERCRQKLWMAQLVTGEVGAIYGFSIYHTPSMEVPN